MAFPVTDMFSHEVNYGGAFSADGASITFDSKYTGLLVQSMQWGYMQSITRLYDVTSTDVVLVSGRTQGQGSMSRVAGPTALTADFYSKYGNVCYADTNTLTVSAEAECGFGGGGDTLSLVMNGLVLSAFGGAIAAQDMVINETLTFQFLAMTYSVA